MSLPDVAPKIASIALAMLGFLMVHFAGEASLALDVFQLSVLFAIWSEFKGQKGDGLDG